MNFSNGLKQGVYMTVAALLLACGGGGGGNVAGIGGTGITASGTITGFGSIFVNGVEFETGNASIVVDDNPGVESDLRLGMVVTVTGSLNAGGATGTATMVAFDDELQGQIQTVPADPTGDGRKLGFTVLGVSVMVDKVSTVFANGVTFTSIAQGDFIEASGFVDQAGVLQATRVEGKGVFTPGVSEIELKGTATNAAGNSFTLGSFNINTAGADLSGVPGGAVTSGMSVEVKGTLNGNTIDASRVKLNDDLPGANLAKVSIEGIVTNFVSNSSFRVAGQAVNAANAVFIPAGLVLGNGVEVEVEGPVVNGTLQAISVETRGGNVELEAAVQGVSNVNGTITLQYFTGTVTVQVDSQTSLRDDLGVFDPFSLSQVVASDFLEVRGSLDGAGNIIASEIRRDTADDDILQGPFTACDGTSVTLFGVSFSLVNGVTTFQDENDQAVYANASAFCADANNKGLFVKVKDDVVANGIADEAELEN
jgi:hypothetical protein